MSACDDINETFTQCLSPIISIVIPNQLRAHRMIYKTFVWWLFTVISSDWLKMFMVFFRRMCVDGKKEMNIKNACEPFGKWKVECEAIRTFKIDGIHLVLLLIEYFKDGTIVLESHGSINIQHQQFITPIWSMLYSNWLSSVK